MSERLALAERVARAASARGIQTALIGAAALAVHGYVRATEDVDLASNVSPGEALRPLVDDLVALGLKARLQMPDAEDDLGGVLKVWETEDEDDDPVDPIDVVNFENPFRPLRTPAARAVANAVAIDGDSALRCVTLPDLVALKLYSGSRNDAGDIVALLKRNPDADLEAVRAIAGPFDRNHLLETLIAEAQSDS